MNGQQRGPWYLVTGLVLGLAIGIFYTWVFTPIGLSAVTPATLSGEFKDAYREMIAQAYAATGDFSRAQVRLALLQDEDVPRALQAQAQRALAEGLSVEEVRPLVELAAIVADPAGALPTRPADTFTPESTAPESTATFTEGPASTVTPTPRVSSTERPSGSQTTTPRPSRTPTPPATPLPTGTPTPTPAQPFILESSSKVCDPDLIAPLIIILAEDAAGAGVPGVEVIVAWPGGEEHFFTGLKPELGLGYADFEMTPGISYSVRLSEAGQFIDELTVEPCDNGQLGSWEVLFVQP